MKSAVNDSVILSEHFNATPKQIWDAWTNASLLLRWFGSDPDGKGIQASLEVQPGSSYQVTFSDSDGTEHTCHGQYAEVEPHKKLSFSWTWKSEPGVESFVTVELTPQSNYTVMRFEHARVGTASAHNYTEGWRRTFEKLRRVLDQHRT